MNISSWIIVVLKKPLLLWFLVHPIPFCRFPFVASITCILLHYSDSPQSAALLVITCPFPPPVTCIKLTIPNPNQYQFSQKTDSVWASLLPIINLVAVAFGCNAALIFIPIPSLHPSSPTFHHISLHIVISISCIFSDNAFSAPFSTTQQAKNDNMVDLAIVASPAASLLWQHKCSPINSHRSRRSYEWI